MSVPNQTPYIIYNANGLTTVFPFEFYIINTGDIQVTINGTEVTSGYSVSGTGNVGGGDVIFITPPASGSVVMLERVVPTYRLTDYQDNGDLLADTVNKDFDRLWMAIQRSFIYLGLTLRRPLFGGPYDAQGYRIEKGADPVNQQDFATKNYVDNISLVRTLRVPESQVSMLPPASQRANQMLAFDNSGQPIVVLPPSGSASEVLIELASSEDRKGDALIAVKQPYTGSVARTQHQKNAEFISVTDFGAIGDGVADDSSAFNAAIQAAKLSGGRGMELHVPAPAVAYKVKNVNIDCAIHLIGSSKSSSLVKPVSGGDTCFLINSDFVTMSGITIHDSGRTSLSTGLQINKGYMTLYNCYIALIGTCISFAKNSGEHNMYNVRLAESKWGLIMPGGQVNTRLNGFVIGNVDGAIKVRESIDESDKAPTEGLVFTDCLIAGCGNPSESIPAVDILGTRWTWFNNTMVDLSKFVAVYLDNAESVKFTGGYLSSNQSANSACLVVRGKSHLFDAVNLTVADSRSWGVVMEKTSDGAPDGARFTNLTVQNNDINPSQQGDLLVNSVNNVCAYNSKFASQKTEGIAVIDNSNVGSSLYLDGCSMSGQAYIGGSSCILKNRNSPTHPEEQVGVVTIPNGANTVSTPLKIVPFESGKGVGVSASPASGNDVITSGVQGTNIVFNRVSTGAATTVSFYAFSTK